MRAEFRIRETSARIVVSLAFLLTACSPGPDPADHFFTDPWPYYLYLPEGYTPERSWPLFIAVHGSADDGRDCWNTWQRYADERGFVLLCPQLADPDGRLHQLRGNERLENTINALYGEYSLAPQIFLAGFSAGGQFVQGYVFENPNYVSGVSVMAPGNVYQPTTAASHIPFSVIVGQDDDPGNVEVARQLAALLDQGGYPVELQVLPHEGHRVSRAAVDLTLNLFNSVITGP